MGMIWGVEELDNRRCRVRRDGASRTAKRQAGGGVFSRCAGAVHLGDGRAGEVSSALRGPSYKGMAWLGVIVASALVGCAKPEVSIPSGIRIEGYEEKIKRIGADPIAYLEECLAVSRRVKSFKTDFQRQERLGVFHELKPMENILAEYRDEPFSVRFTWKDKKSKYLQCVYIEGQENGLVQLMPRQGPFGLPPSVQKWPAKLAVEFHQSRNPITDFGPRRLLERTLDRIEEARAHGEVSIQLRDATEIGPAKEPCFHLELRYPAGDKYPCKLQDLYIHAQTQLPVATYLWLPGRDERSEATLDGMYVYGRLDPEARLTDANFVIEPVKQAKKTNRKGTKAREGAETGGAAAMTAGGVE